MKIENLKTDLLIPYEWNNRKHSEEQISKIANSIQEFGFNQPIVTCDKNIILVGHARLEAAKRLGLETVPVVRLSKLSEAQKKAYRILDNKLQNDSEWNFENLEKELNQLVSFDFNIDEWGLTDFILDTSSIEEKTESEIRDIPEWAFVLVTCKIEDYFKLIDTISYLESNGFEVDTSIGTRKQNR